MSDSQDSSDEDTEEADFEAPVQDTRICVNCGQEYSPKLELESASEMSYVDSPWNYGSGCGEYCLACWLCDDWFKPSIEAPDQFDDTDLPF